MSEKVGKLYSLKEKGFSLITVTMEKPDLILTSNVSKLILDSNWEN